MANGAGQVVLRLGIAFALGLAIGWERELSARSAGLRTFPLVAMGACAFLLIGQHAFGPSPDAQARVFQGLLTGIGFIGGGAILKGEHGVHGVATAAGLWNTGAIGAAAAYDDYLLAGTITLITLVILHFFPRFHVRRQQDTGRDERSAR